MNGKNRIVPLILMITSIALLIVLQVLWMRGAYHKAKEDLSSETNMLFRNTVFAMRDSIFQRSIQPITEDSTSNGIILKYHTIDSLPHRFKVRDSVVRRIAVPEEPPKIQIFVSSHEEDSINQFIKPLASRFFGYRRSGNFTLRLISDSLKLDSLHILVSAALHKAGIDIPFQLEHHRRGDEIRHAGTFVSDQVRINPMHRYSLTFTSVNGFLMRSIIPQFLFSLFVTLLTMGSFFVIYRNLRAQERMAALKNDFISNVTHELKTPITTVRVALEALKNFKGLENPELTREYLDIAQNELNRLTLLTESVLKTAIFESHGVRFETGRINLVQLINQVVDSLRLLLEKSGARLSFVHDESSFDVLGNADHLSNVIYNLLDNALKYNEGAPEITIALHKTDSAVVVAIEDNGPGIDKEFHKKIFEKFFRVPSGDIHNVKGYGLGLNYVENAIKAHRGSIRLESEPGHGAKFFITLAVYE